MLISDWSSDVCSSDLAFNDIHLLICMLGFDKNSSRADKFVAEMESYMTLDKHCEREKHKQRMTAIAVPLCKRDRQSVVKGQSVSVRVGLVRRGITKKKIT